jgi:glutamyl-tRNA reductase
VEWLKAMVSRPKPSILLIGTGKFGHNLLKNLVHYLPEASITLCNRTLHKAVATAKPYNLPVISFEQMQAQVQHFEVVITCTNAPEPILGQEQLDKAKTYYLIDLSMPANIDAAVGQLSGVHLVNIDEISGILQQTYARRKADLPAAEQIVNNGIQQFYNWLEAKRFTTVVNNLKPLFEAYAVNLLTSAYKMNRPGQCANTTAIPQQQVHTAVKQLMINLKRSPHKGCAILTTYQHLVNCN